MRKPASRHIQVPQTPTRAMLLAGCRLALASGDTDVEAATDLVHRVWTAMVDVSQGGDGKRVLSSRQAEASLRKRCAMFLGELKTDAMLRQGSPVDDLMAFVSTETGRTADARLDNSLPLCLYFKTAAEREEFIAAYHAVNPNAVTKVMP